MSVAVTYAHKLRSYDFSSTTEDGWDAPLGLASGTHALQGIGTALYIRYLISLLIERLYTMMAFCIYML